jgi:hypothetical protein
MADAGLGTREIKAAFAEAAERARYERKKKDIRYGMFWLLGGVILTLVFYGAAVEGGTYLVTGVAVVVGLMQLIRGYGTRTRFDRDPEIVDDEDWYDEKQPEDEDSEEEDDEGEASDDADEDDESETPADDDDSGDDNSDDEKPATR